MKPKTLLGLRLCLGFLYMAIIIRQWPDPEAQGACSGSPQTCRVSEDPHAVPGWKNSLEGKPVVKQIIVLGTQSRGDPRGAADTRAGSIRESRSCVALKPQVWRQKAGWWPRAAAADTLSK